MISVIIPTITGREHWLERCVASYERTMIGVPHELIVVKDRPACGLAWNDGWLESKGDYIHFTADDIEAHDGWWEAAVACTSEYTTPAPRLLNSDGSFQASDVAWEREDGVAVSFTRVPFLSLTQAKIVVPIVETHYSTDVWVSEILRLNGIQTRQCNGYLLTHHYAPEGRVDERLASDREIVKSEYAVYRERTGLPLPEELWAECAPQ